MNGVVGRGEVLVPPGMSPPAPPAVPGGGGGLVVGDGVAVVQYNQHQT